MSKRKSKISLNVDKDVDYDTSVEEQAQRNKVSFSTMLRPGLYEKLKAAAFWEDRSIADITGAALETYLEALEDERNEKYEIWDRHKVS